MQTNCPACGAPITDNAHFCSHCGSKLPENVQRIEIKSQNVTEIKYEDTAKLEEIRLKYALEERNHQEKSESKQVETKTLKNKRWISWLLCIIFLCLGVSFSSNETITAISGILFMVTGIYALIITITSIIKKYRS